MGKGLLNFGRYMQQLKHIPRNLSFEKEDSTIWFCFATWDLSTCQYPGPKSSRTEEIPCVSISKEFVMSHMQIRRICDKVCYKKNGYNNRCNPHDEGSAIMASRSFQTGQESKTNQAKAKRRLALRNGDTKYKKLTAHHSRTFYSGLQNPSIQETRFTELSTESPHWCSERPKSRHTKDRDHRTILQQHHATRPWEPNTY